MMYLLDFDHTLMDTEALKGAAKADGSEVLVGTPAFWQYHTVMDFLFPDVLPWLKSKPKESLHILTAYKPSQGPQAKAFQEAKLRSGGFADLVASVTVVEGMKGEWAVQRAKRYQPSQPVSFIDDRPDQCASVKAALPDACCFLMVRYQVCPAIVPPGVIPVYSLMEVDTELARSAVGAL